MSNGGEEEKFSKDFFTLDEDFPRIIKRALRDRYGDIKITSIKDIAVGWTNSVKRVNTSLGEFIFRFPRDGYWGKVIVKDYEFAYYIHGFTCAETIDLHLAWDMGRPFSFHSLIPGFMLAEKMETMSPEDITKVSRQISQWMHSLHTMKYEPEHIFRVQNIGLSLQPFMDELLREHLSQEDMAFWHKGNDFADLPEGECLIHGDFNASNVIVDESNNLAAIIDFGFGGFGSKYFDISRIIGRCTPEFKEPLLEAYEEAQGKPLDRREIDKNINIWADIDRGYINYMRRVGIYNL